MIEVLSVENMRKSDTYTIKNYVISKELMFRAGKGVFDSIQWKPPVAVVCGSGNNAGDGYVIAKLLNDGKIPCTLFLLEEKFSPDGKYYYDLCVENRIEAVICNEKTDFSNYNTVVDCIFGTGFRGEVQGLAKSVIESINKSSAYVVSVDINSGLNGNNGIASLCVKSDVTVSVGGYKYGHFLNMAKDVMAFKVNCDIGIKPVEKPAYLVEKSDFKELFKPRKNYSNKGTFGYTALIGGSKRYSGAIRLAYMANAAMRSGAGVVKTAVPDSLSSAVVPQILESTLFPLSDIKGEVQFAEKEISELIGNVKTVAFGMGIGVTEETAKILRYLLENYNGTLIIDADGLTLLSQEDKNLLKNVKCRVVLTPHIKEFSRLTHCEIDEILINPVDMAQQYAKENGVVLLLKGPTTVITNGEETYLTDAGCAGMATAGSGDVLSGILCAVCSYCDDLLLGVAAGAFVNGKAGELAQKKYNSISMTASDTVDCIADVISDIQNL